MIPLRNRFCDPQTTNSGRATVTNSSRFIPFDGDPIDGLVSEKTTVQTISVRFQIQGFQVIYPYLP